MLPPQADQPLLYQFIHKRFDYLLKGITINAERHKDLVIEQITNKYRDMYQLNLEVQQSIHNIEKKAEKQRKGTPKGYDCP